MTGVTQNQETTPTEYRQNNRCHICRKGIVWPGLCYSCATGRPRLLMRPDERQRLADLSGDGPDLLSLGRGA